MASGPKNDWGYLMTAKRLRLGGRIDRDKILNFTWDGQELEGYSGDTLASALVANNRKIIGRSFKYHRPRGITSSGVEESGAIVTVGKGARKEVNVRATTQELYRGLTATGQNAWPNVRFDFGSISNYFSKFLGAGFYYKTFMGIPPFEWGRGTKIWMFYEKYIRKAAGMGAASREPDPDNYEHAHGFCDVAIIGSGPAGLAAALELSKTNQDVMLIEQDFELGGDYLNYDSKSEDLARILLKINKSNIRIMKRTTAFGAYDHGTLGLLERVGDHLSTPLNYLPRHRFWTIRAKRIILATGAIERHFAFSNNDIPGIMTASSARTYLNRYGILPGEHIVISTNNDSAYIVSQELKKAGANVTLLDARASIPNHLTKKITGEGIELISSAAVSEAVGRSWVSKIKFASLIDDKWINQGEKSCDLLLISGGWSPVINLISHRGSKAIWDERDCCFLAGHSKEAIDLIGSARGIWRIEDCVKSGINIKHALEKNKVALSKSYKVTENKGWENPIIPLYEVEISNKKSFVDLQHDVTTQDIRAAHQEGFVSVEHLKRYTTLGMATDQGKTGNVIGIALMAKALNATVTNVGTTTFRPPYTPISLGALAGRNTDDHFRPLRRTPMDDWNLANSAVMTHAGLWRRPWYFPVNGENISQSYIREARTTRNKVGLCDVTSLGKIAIQGPDATEFLNRVYTNPFAKLPINKARYGIMLRDDGVVLDDGTTWRLSETDYFMTTTTANAARVMSWLEELLQVRWNTLKVHITSVTDQWAGCAIAGPLSRKVLEKCVKDSDCVSNENLPFMGITSTFLFNDIPCRIARISFSGEMASEIYVPSDYGHVLMEILWETAESLGGCLYGLEALGAMRIEKGHVTGAELDGRVTLEDAGLAKMASTKKDFIGSALRKRPEMIKAGRPQLVGIFPEDINATFNAGSIICDESNLNGHGEGWVTAVTYSPVFNHWIGIGFISGGYQNWQNKVAVAADPIRDKETRVKIVSPYMYDPEGKRHYG